MVLNSQEGQAFRHTIETDAEFIEVKRVIPTYEALKEEGRKKGQEEGRKDGFRQAIVSLLAKRFGEVDPAIISRLDEIHGLAQLRSILLSSVDVESPAELFS